MDGIWKNDAKWKHYFQISCSYIREDDLWSCACYAHKYIFMGSE